MNTMQRAWLYITRKKGKTILMFFILFIMATAIISGISIKKASETALAQAREAVGGNFQMYVDYSESNPNIKTTQKEYGSKSENMGPPLDNILMEKIAQTKGIKGYNGTTQTFLDDNGLQYKEAPTGGNNFSFSTDASGNSSNKVPNIRLNTELYSQLDPMFSDGSMKLVEGRHIIPSDSRKVLVHKDFADKNNFKLGDKVPLKLNTNESATSEVEIVGIFDTEKKAENTMLLTSMMPENTLIGDMQSHMDLHNKETVDFDNATFYVDDPKEMLNIVDEVKKLDVDWKQFMIDTNDDQYQMIAGSITSVERLVTIILYAVIVVSGVILTLILSLWIKGRIYETGVLLSFGIGKGKIVGQYILELMMIALLSFTLSYFSGKAISQSLGSTMMDSAIAQKEAQQNAGGMSFVTSMGGGAISGESDTIKELDVSVTANELCYMYVIGCGLIILSVVLSSWAVLRLRPKEILSKMS